jgi:hypothetical protein
MDAERKMNLYYILYRDPDVTKGKIVNIEWSV